MSDDFLKPGGALDGNLFRGFLKRLSDSREPEASEREVLARERQLLASRSRAGGTSGTGQPVRIK